EEHRQGREREREQRVTNGRERTETRGGRRRAACRCREGLRGAGSAAKGGHAALLRTDASIGRGMRALCGVDGAERKPKPDERRDGSELDATERHEPDEQRREPRAGLAELCPERGDEEQR